MLFFFSRFLCCFTNSWPQKWLQDGLVARFGPVGAKWAARRKAEEAVEAEAGRVGFAQGLVKGICFDVFMLLFWWFWQDLPSFLVISPFAMIILSRVFRVMFLYTSSFSSLFSMFFSSRLLFGQTQAFWKLFLLLMCSMLFRILYYYPCVFSSRMFFQNQFLSDSWRFMHSIVLWTFFMVF